jgi:choline monooxygenase
MAPDDSLETLRARVSAQLAAFDDQAPVEASWTIPASWYTSTDLAEVERCTVFGRTWQLVGRASQVDAPGKFVTAEVAGEPIVVIRGADGVLRGFFNVCRHHAAAVLTEPAGCVSRMQCPYHAWTYGLDGTLKSMPEFEGVRDFDKAKFGLVPVAVAQWEHFVFVNLHSAPQPFGEALGSLGAQVAPLGLTSLQFAERRTYELQCNWKVFVDNYLDGGYHVPFLHPGLSSVLSFKDYTIENFERHCLQSSPIDPAGGEAVTASVRTGRALYYWLYPNLMLNWYQGYLDTNFVEPLAINRTRVTFDFYFADVSEAVQQRNRTSMDVSERIQDEDHAICESVQRGLGSRAYTAGRLSARREAGERLFHRLLAADLRA